MNKLSIGLVNQTLRRRAWWIEFWAFQLKAALKIMDGIRKFTAHKTQSTLHLSHVERFNFLRHEMTYKQR